MSKHPAASTIQAIRDGNPDRKLVYNSLAFKYAGCCVMDSHPRRHAWTRGGVRLDHNLRWWHLCRECWDALTAPAIDAMRKGLPHE